MTITLNPDHDIDALAAEFSRRGRIHIPKFMTGDSARAIYNAVRREKNWNFVFFAGGKHYDLDAAGWANLDAEKRATTTNIVHQEAQRSFSYMYDNIPIFDRVRGGGALSDTLRETYEFLNSGPFLGFARRLVGADDIAFADAQATRYGPGSFLTDHNDGVEGKNRRAAFVVNLTPEWRVDWGGFLNFFDENGNIEEAFKPTFNALNVFQVPAPHSVGYVTPFAGAPRYSVTGWLRAGSPDA